MEPIWVDYTLSMGAFLDALSERYDGLDLTGRIAYALGRITAQLHPRDAEALGGALAMFFRAEGDDPLAVSSDLNVHITSYLVRLANAGIVQLNGVYRSHANGRIVLEGDQLERAFALHKEIKKLATALP